MHFHFFSLSHFFRVFIYEWIEKSAKESMKWVHSVYLLRAKLVSKKKKYFLYVLYVNLELVKCTDFITTKLVTHVSPCILLNCFVQYIFCPTVVTNKSRLILCCYNTSMNISLLSSFGIFSVHFVFSSHFSNNDRNVYTK